MSIKVESGKSEKGDNSQELARELLKSQIEIERGAEAEVGGQEYDLSSESITGAASEIERKPEPSNQWDDLITPLTRKEWGELIEQSKQSLEALAGAEPELVFLVRRAVGSLDVSMQRLCNEDRDGCRGALQLAENSLSFMRTRLDQEIETSTLQERAIHSALLRSVNYFEQAFRNMEGYLEQADPMQLFEAYDNLGDGIMSIVASKRMTDTSAA